MLEQDRYTDKDVLEEFILEYGIIPTDRAKVVSKDALYDAYSIWAGRNGIKPVTSQWFTKRMVNKKIDSLFQGAIRYFKINADCTIGNNSLGVVNVSNR
jgi:hypothetical protein